jgi:purine nucleosidase
MLGHLPAAAVEVSTVPQQRHVILDMDMGIDDAVAVLYLASRPQVTIAAAGSVHGNTPADLAAGNLLRVLAMVGHPEVPVAIGARRPMVREAHFAGEVHGDDGLGNTLAAGDAAPGAVTAESAPAQIIRLAQSAPSRYDILATGPLTNLALALVLDPDLPSRIGEVVVMGGATHGGNITPVAEANIWHDPEAAQIVFAAPWKVTMVGLDVTMQTILDETAIATIAGAAKTSATARFATGILRHYLDFYERISGRRACPLHDPTAAAVYADPDLVRQRILADVVVAVSDDARGQTIVDRRHNGGQWAPPREPATTVVLEVDAPRFTGDLVRVLTA